MQRVLDLAAQGRLEEAAAVDTLGMTFQDVPTHAAHAMVRAHGVSKVPIPRVIKGGQRRLIADLELMAVAVALKAVSVMDDEREYAVGRIRLADLGLTCNVQPEPRPALFGAAVKS